jgi:hypothetical protein
VVFETVRNEASRLRLRMNDPPTAVGGILPPTSLVGIPTFCAKPNGIVTTVMK